MEKGGGHGQAEGRHGKQGERGSYTQGQQSPEGGEIIKNAIFSGIAGPDWIRIQQGPWIRIRNPYPDPGGQNDP